MSESSRPLSPPASETLTLTLGEYTDLALSISILQRAMFALVDATVDLASTIQDERALALLKNAAALIVESNSYWDSAADKLKSRFETSDV